MLHSSYVMIEAKGEVATSSFVALSYCWRNPEWEAVSHPFEPLDYEESIPISKCLWHFLVNLLESDEEAVWIDQVCLDQNDDVEKTVAVQSMDALYASARFVFIALEDIFLSRQEVETLSEAFRRLSMDDERAFSTESARAIFAILAKIFSARWFSRAWCFHEYHMSNRRIFAIPCEDFAGDPHKHSAVGLTNLSEFISRLTYFQSEALQAENPKLIQRMLSFFGGQDYAYSNVIANTFSLNCKWFRDQVTIALNICGLGIAIKQKEVEQAEFRLYLLILALGAGDATILTTRGPKVQYGDGLSKTSWLQWPEETTWSKRHPFPLPEGIRSISPNQTTLDLLILSDECIRTITPSALRVARGFLQSALADKIRVAYGLQDKEDTQLLEPGTLSSLACALDCGFSWMSDAWSRLEDEVASEVDESYAAVETVMSPCLEYLFGGPGRSLPGDRAATAFRTLLCVLLFGRYWEMGSSARLGAPADLALCDIHKAESTFRIPAPSEHKLYGRFAYKTFERQTTTLAVPTVLAADRFNLSDRLWLLEPAMDDTGSCWRIKEKVALIGAPSLCPDGEYITLKKHQRIIG